MLYTLFEWAAAPQSNLILVGIANALDLTQRLLPQLRALGATPQTLHFPPYSDAELSSILTQRLTRSALATVAQGGSSALARLSSGEKGETQAVSQARDAIDANAVTFCCKKVANVSGDARRMLDVSRLAIEKAVDELESCPLEQLPPWAAKPLIRFDHMASALSVAFKSSAVLLLASLPQAQQVLVCALVLRSRRIAAKAAAAAAAAESELSEQAAARAAAASAQYLLQARPRASAKASSVRNLGVVSAAGKKTAVTAAVHHLCTLSDLHKEVRRRVAANL